MQSDHEKEWLQRHYNVWNEIVEALEEYTCLDGATCGMEVKNEV